jgi:hypothetical protein
MQLRPCVDTSRSSTFLCSADTSRCSSGPVADTSRSSTLLCSADMFRCSSGPHGVDTSRCSTFLCSADTSRCSSGPVEATSGSSTLLCCADTSRCSSGLWQTPSGVVHSSVVQTRPYAAQAPVVYTVRSACKLRARRTEYKSVFFQTT